MAAIYDGLLLFSVLLIAAIPALFFTGGQAVPAGNFIFEGYLFLICFAYYGTSWTRGGATLGAKSWRLQVVQDDGQAVTWSRALLRFIWCLISLFSFGIGYWWVLVDKRNCGWADRMTATRIIVKPRA